jgi:hypothetical protein
LPCGHEVGTLPDLSSLSSILTPFLFPQALQLDSSTSLKPKRKRLSVESTESAILEQIKNQSNRSSLSLLSWPSLPGDPDDAGRGTPPIRITGTRPEMAKGS